MPERFGDLKPPTIEEEILRIRKKIFDTAGVGDITKLKPIIDKLNAQMVRLSEANELRKSALILLNKIRVSPGFQDGAHELEVKLDKLSGICTDEEIQAVKDVIRRIEGVTGSED